MVRREDISVPSVERDGWHVFFSGVRRLMKLPFFNP